MLEYLVRTSYNGYDIKVLFFVIENIEKTHRWVWVQNV